MRFVAAVCCVLLGVSAHADRRRAVVPAPAWNASLTITKRDAQTIGASTFYSSASLMAQWSAPSSGADHYLLTATETSGGAPLTYTAKSSATSATIAALESGTEYRIVIRACLNAACSSSIDGNSAVVTTDEEYWQVRGTGSSFATAARIVSDGNTKAYALLWGAEAGASLAGKAQLYYDPSTGTEKGVKIGTMSAPITVSPDSVGSYSGLSGFGFRRNDVAGQQGTGPATFQVVALSGGLGAKVRLFYEASDADGHARVYSVDSRDGWLGRDFHSGSATICQEADIVPGGACAATLAIGVAGDGNPKVDAARQLKVGLPTLNSWTWDGEPGTFMVVTLHFGADKSCTSSFFNLGYAIWDGSRWNLQYDANGCPKTIPGIQAPMPVHVGGVRYKLYFNHNTTSNGGVNQFKPMKLLYADGATTGDPSLVDFEDWESIARARRVNYLWPSGSLLTDEEKSMLDDYQIWMPTNDPAFQVIYSNMSCPNNACGAPFIGMAVLANP
jgi:hypothetical protein